MSYGHAQYLMGTPQNTAYAQQLAQQQQQQGTFRPSAQQIAQAQAAQAQAIRAQAQAQASGTPAAQQSTHQGARAMGAQQQQPQNAQGDHVPIGDGNDGLRSAKLVLSL